MNSIGFKFSLVLMFLGCSLIFSQLAFSENPWSIRVINQTQYTVAIDDVESKSVGKYLGFRTRKVWDLGPYKPSMDRTDSLHSGGMNYIIGIEGQTEAHVIIIKNFGSPNSEKRSDYNAGLVRMEAGTHTKEIKFDDREFIVKVEGQEVTERGIEISEDYIAPISDKYLFFTITVSQK